jgi:ribosome biogenesis GTPase
MNIIPNKLKEIGFDKWFLEAVSPESLERFEVARVVAVHKDRYTVSNGEVDTLAELIGKIMFSASSPLDYPAVGDWVLAFRLSGSW